MKRTTQAKIETAGLGLVINNDKVMVSSRSVAVKFGKRHDDILKRIKNLECSEDFSARNFAGAEYTDEQGKPRPEILMTRDGVSAIRKHIAQLAKTDPEFNLVNFDESSYINEQGKEQH